MAELQDNEMYYHKQYQTADCLYRLNIITVVLELNSNI